jgi:hypothetical protein
MPGVVLVSTIISTRIAEEIGNKLTVSLGILISGIGLLYFSLILTPGTTYGILVGGMVILATGMGLTMSPSTNAIQGSLPVDRAGIGSAMNNATRQVGGALGVAVLGSLMNVTYLNKIENVGGFTTLPGKSVEAIRSSIQGAHIVAEQLPKDISQAIVKESSLAFVSGMTNAMFVGAIIMGVTALITFILLPKQVHILQEHLDTTCSITSNKSMERMIVPIEDD